MAGRHTVVLPARSGESASVVEPSAFDPAGTGRGAPALVVHTSGSTGAPKGVALSADALRASAEATASYLGGHGRWYLALPPNHIAGAQVLLRSQLAGTTPFVAQGRFSAQGFAQEVRDLRTAALHSAAEPLYTSLVPTQLVRIMRDPAAVRAAAAFDAILLGGAALSPALLARAADAGLRIVRTYGMSETGGGCVYDGVPFDGVRVAITAHSRIELAGPVLADGYIAHDPSAGTLRALPDEGTGFSGAGTARAFLTSDLGRLAGGVLSVLGRADDVIITGGENVSPLAVEHALLALLEPHGVAEVLVTSVPDEEWGERLVALVTAEAGEFSAARGADPQRQAGRVRELAAKTLLQNGGPSAPRSAPPAAAAVPAAERPALAPHERPMAVITVGALPTTGIGKPDRRAARALAARRLSGSGGSVGAR
ncbi:AMP-binding protein [Brevibacterium sp. BRM-1]|uniref:AMP-binding protein n=1 Tax=Brevibacterium sp. BRM-1 TaxID=2999062 RepID=UPI0022813951|nr:AMP-binding protein [Brevibacterium sp. BRM-1]WAL41566.1 AMP-binding protein [Brevibacterium sp. BRM-1]